MSDDKKAVAEQLRVALEALPRKGFLVWIEYPDHPDRVTWCHGSPDELALSVPGGEGMPIPATDMSLADAEALAEDVRRQLGNDPPAYRVRVMDLATREDAVTLPDQQLGLFD